MSSSPVHYYTTSGDETQARKLAGRVARRAEDAAAPYTTPDIEAAVVRLLGIAQNDPTGVSLAQRFAGWLNDRGLLGTGSAHWLAGAAIRRQSSRPRSLTANDVAWVLDRDPAPSEIAIPVEVTPQVLEHAVRGARRALTAQWRARDERLATLALGPDRRVVEIAPGDSATLRAAAREGVGLVLLAYPAGSLPTAQSLRHARAEVDRASERAGRYIRLGARGSRQGTATLATLVALAGLDVLAVTDLDDADAFFARRICAQAGVTFLGLGHAGDALAASAARALVAEQLAALAGLPPPFWGWVPARPAHREFLAALFPDAFIAHPQGTDAGPDDDPSHEDTTSRILVYLENWPTPTHDPATLVKKAPGYWNPFT